jgi:hypothetical protein
MLDTKITTTLSLAIHDYEQRSNLKFTPDEKFYDRIGINRIRFWQLVKGKKRMFTDEAQALANYFGITVTDLL